MEEAHKLINSIRELNTEKNAGTAAVAYRTLEKQWRSAYRIASIRAARQPGATAPLVIPLDGARIPLAFVKG
jgi:hypothetical protein